MTGELLIDTSTLIDFFQDNVTKDTDELMKNSELTISVVTLGEIRKFLLNTGRNNLWNEYKQRLLNYKTLDVTKEISENAGALAYRFRLSFADSIIYATALENNLTLLTSDSDFKGKKGVILVKRT